jgi:HK97 family phage major capsid protein
MAVRTVISNDLLEDAIIDLGNLVATDAALKFAEKEDDCGFNGDGTSTYGGIVGLKNALLAGATKTAATGNTAFSTLDLADFEGMVGLLPSYARSGAKWFISQAGWADSMLRLLNAGGGNTMVDLGNGPRLSFLGYEVVVSQKMNSTLTAQTSTNGLVFLGRLDLAATVGVKRGIRVSVLRELYAATRQTGLIIDQRMDINCHERGTASVSGPVVMLATPGS